MERPAARASQPEVRHGHLGRWISPTGLAALALAAVAVALGVVAGLRWLTISLAACGLTVVLVSSWATRGRGAASGRLLQALGGILCAAVVLVTLFAPGVLNRYWSMDAVPADVDLNVCVVVARERPAETGRPLSEDEWVEAATDGIRQQDLMIQLESVKAGRLLEKGATSFLLVNFRLDQLWQGRTNTFERFVPGKDAPSLVDNTGRTYAFLGDRVRKAPTKFDLMLKVDHLLVFELPPSGVEYLNLELSASAWGRKGMCRFRIVKVAQETTPDMAKLVARTKAMLLAPPAVAPDPPLGRALFVKTCMECHTLYGLGGKVGPDLTGSKRGDLDFVLTSIIDPSAVIEKQFLPTIIEMTSGKVYNAIVKESDADTVTIQVSSKVEILRRSDIESMRESKVSIMPTELLKPFEEHEVRSLIAYLTGKVQVPLLATPDNAPYYFFYGQDLTNWYNAGAAWKAEAMELVTPDALGGKPSLLISNLHMADDFHLFLRLNPGKDGRGAVLIRDASRPTSPTGPRVEFVAGAPVALIGTDGQRVAGQEDGSAADAEVKPESWDNKLEIIAADGRLRVRLNNKDVAERADLKLPARYLIALEGPSIPGQEVRFRNLDMRLIPQKK
jgi:putative heme-binding domain-containing protein